MLVPAAPLPLLTRLRRSTCLAVFMALVMMAKVVGSYACVGEGLASVRGDGPTQQVATLGDGAHLGAVLSATDHGDPQALHAAGSCCHCSCHQATALPGTAWVTHGPSRLAPLPSVAGGIARARLERELRPPIV
jgi:hypothetical protein